MTNSAQVQSLQRQANPPKMKLLLNHCLVKCNVHHPLYFLQNDHPGLILISKKLTGSENYNTWKRSIMIALNARNRLKMVNGEYEEPVVHSPLRSLWERANDMLNGHYSQLNGHRIYQVLNVHSPLRSLWERANDMLNGHYSQLNGLWNELDALEAPYACVFPCDCTNGRTNVIKAYIMLRQEEMQRAIPKPTLTIPTTLNTTSNYRPPHVNRNKPSSQTVRRTPFRKGFYCTICKKEGHYREECYKIVGYPPSHPIHNKYVLPSQRNNSNSRINVVNQANGSESANVVLPNYSDTPNTSSTPSDTSVHSRMDQLQNQLNQVLLNLQNNP
ncbi:cysteine-rich receptor-like protein kinase 8 [Tanacetum coccineum]